MPTNYGCRYWSAKFRMVCLPGAIEKQPLKAKHTMKICLRLLLPVLLSCWFVAASAATPVTITSADKNYQLGQYLEVLEDPAGALTINEAAQSKDFKPTTQKVPNLAISKSTFWVRFKVTNTTQQQEFLLNLAYPIIDTVILYEAKGNGQFTASISGESVPITERKYRHQNLIFNLDLPQGEEKTYYLKISSGEQVMLPISIGTPKTVFLSTSSFDLYNGLYFGIVLVMLMYNLFIYFSVRDKSYLLYVGYILFVGLTQASDSGYTYRILWPNAPALANFTVTLFPSLVGTSAILFMRYFLNTRKHLGKWDNIFFVLIFVYSLCVALFAAGLPQISYQLTQITALTVSVYMLVMAFKIMRGGYRPARFFFIAWSVFLLSVCLFVMKDLGVLPYNNFTKHILQIGSAIELILLSFALADKINILKLEKEESQARTMEALLENERIMREQNTVLDTKVKERTSELQKTNTVLNLALTELKEAQVQLVEAEKMASLGVLTAGIAHEINNPINFVVSNINPLKRDIQDIMDVLHKYAEIKDETGLRDKLDEINELKEDIDLEYVVTEIDQLLKGIEDGAGRTAEIVKSLRTFSRLDETDLKKANINECLDSTLLLLNNSLKDKINVQTEFAEIQPVECFPGKLNQLFMNILKNAVQAIEAKKYTGGEKPAITVVTKDINDEIVVRITDNGTGMDEITMSRIFEPFFTTKDVGEGTGLGLSIGYNIIEKHHGIIDVESEKGVGTEFMIVLPKTQSADKALDKNRLNELKRERKLKLREGAKTNQKLNP